MNWISVQDRLPGDSGVYLVFAPSADPDKPLYAMAWYELPDEVNMPGWQLLPAQWCEAITHWIKPTPPEKDRKP